MGRNKRKIGKIGINQKGHPMERFGFGHPFIEKKEPRSFLIKLTKKRVESLDSGCDIKIYPKRSSLIENQNTICPLTNNPTYTSWKILALNPFKITVF